MNTESKRKFIIDVAFAALVLLLIYLGVRYLLVWLLPFVVGLVVARMLHGPILCLTRRFGGGRKIIATVLTFLLVAVVLGAISFAVYYIGHAIVSFLRTLPDLYANDILRYLDILIEKVQGLLDIMPAVLQQQVSGMLSSFGESLKSVIASVSGSVISWAASAAAKMPEMMISLIVTVIACFYVSISYDDCVNFVRRIMPRRVSLVMSSVTSSMGSMVAGVIRSYMIVMCITFCELLIGFLILGLDYAPVLAAIIAVVDVLPVLGVGTVLIPWGIICLVIGNMKLGIGMLVLYVIIAIVRNTIEPRIIGNKIGLHPLLTLVLMYVGLKAVGFLGMFLFPLAALVLISIQENGGVRIWKPMDDEEETGE